MSAVALGFWRACDWNYTRQELASLIGNAHDVGITTFDHADIYGQYRAEALFGAAIEILDISRAEMQLITKVGIVEAPGQLKIYDTGQAHIVSSVDRSLANLRTDYVDLLLLHRPDPLMDLDAVAQTFALLIEAGKVRHVGVSNFSPAQVEMLQSRLDLPLVTNQIELSLLEPSALFDGTLDHCQKNRLRPLAWSPLAGGKLFTSRQKRAQAVRAELAAIAGELGATVGQVALSWIISHPTQPIPILGTGQIDRIRAAIMAPHIELPRHDWFRLLKAARLADVP
jgi:predicted oxidoreductase